MIYGARNAEAAEFFLSYELFMLRLTLLLPVFCLFTNHLVALQPIRQQSLTFSSERVLETFFRELFETTTAGYTLYGQKPVDLEAFFDREKTIPGTSERRSSVLGYLALSYWNQIAPDINHQKYILVDSAFPDGREIILINREAFYEIVKRNSLLFEYKLGTTIIPDDLFASLIQNGFWPLFKENIALRGIVLGYGVENSIRYEYGSSFLKYLIPQTSPPNQLPPPSKNREEVLQKIKGGNWGRISKEVEDLTYFRRSEKDARLKIPFSFIKNSKKSTSLLKAYKQYQNNVDFILNKKTFLSDVLQRLGTKLKPSFKQTITSDHLEDFFSNEEKAILHSLVAQTIVNSFHNQISPKFIEGMKTAETATEDQFDFSDTKFLDILWKRNNSQIQPIIAFFENIEGLEHINCLIPRRLYTRTLKTSTSQEELTKNHNKIRVHYLLKDIEDNPLVGTYQLQESSELYLNNTIPGLSHGLLGMKKGEIREIFIHPDFVYGISSDFGKGQAIKAIVELIDLGQPEEKSSFPFLKPIDVVNYAPDIESPATFIALEEKHAFACGLRSWAYYKKASPLISLNSTLDEIKITKKRLLSNSENALILRLEWLLLQT